MAEATWKYQLGGQEFGPVTTEDLCRMFSGGQLPLQTQVWSDPIGKWVAAGTIPGFRQLVPVSAQPVPAQSVYAAPGVALDYCTPENDFDSRPHPWIRFFARGLDATVVMMTLSVVGMVVFRGNYPVPALVVYAVMAVISVFIEALMLSAWGTTPGKAFLGIKVETGSGTKPTYSQALSRSFLVWLIGQGLFIPLVSLITEIVAYSKLSAEGQTVWDRMTALRVRHKPCGAGRVVGGLFLAWGYAMLLGIGSTIFMAVVQLRPMMARAALPPTPTGSFSVVPPTASRPAVIADPKLAALSGTWVIRATQQTGRGPVVWMNTLTLNSDGSFHQSTRALEPSGLTRLGSAQEWSGTWSLQGNQLIQNVTQSTTAHSPKGRWVFVLGEHDSDSLMLRRQSSPQGSAATDSHPIYAFRRSTTQTER